MKTSERLVRKFRNELSNNDLSQAMQSLLGTNDAEYLAKRSALYLYLLELKLDGSQHARSEAKALLGSVQPTDFDIGCGCIPCCARRKEWQRAKEGEM